MSINLNLFNILLNGDTKNYYMIILPLMLLQNIFISCVFAGGIYSNAPYYHKECLPLLEEVNCDDDECKYRFKKTKRVNKKVSNEYETLAIPDEDTAIKVAEIVLSRIYGYESVNRGMPFKATLNHDIWQIDSVKLPIRRGEMVRFGGDKRLLISKINGCIIYINAGK
ncbi:MAG: hypothetical protein G8345_10945 [Magnetococcales bacterium]|nr:hypothetical protein [Magnetococcales bacterium]